MTYATLKDAIINDVAARELVRELRKIDPALVDAILNGAAHTAKGKFSEHMLARELKIARQALAERLAKIRRERNG